MPQCQCPSVQSICAMIVGFGLSTLMQHSLVFSIKYRFSLARTKERTQVNICTMMDWLCKIGVIVSRIAPYRRAHAMSSINTSSGLQYFSVHESSLSVCFLEVSHAVCSSLSCAVCFSEGSVQEEHYEARGENKNTYSVCTHTIVACAKVMCLSICSCFQLVAYCVTSTCCTNWH